MLQTDKTEDILRCVQIYKINRQKLTILEISSVKRWPRGFDESKEKPNFHEKLNENRTIILAIFDSDQSREFRPTELMND